jgi:hypothetical protein
MDIVDYHNVVVLDYLLRTSRKGSKKRIALTAMHVVNEKNSQLEIDIEPEDVERSLFALFGSLDVIETPHASPRFLLDRSTIDDLLDKISESHPETRRAMVLTSDLGWDWLQESIERAFEQDPPSETFVGDKWEPLEVRPADPKTTELAEAIDALAEQVRADNGYAASVPAERNEVVRRLGETSDWLRNAEYLTASAVQVYLVWPLETLAARFSAKTAIGKATQFATGVVAAWLKAHGVKVLDRLFGN